MMLFGLNLQTDHKPLEKALIAVYEAKDDAERVERSDAIREQFPGLVNAVIECRKELEEKRLRPTHVFYYNFRVQVWAMGFDADPSRIIRVLPNGVTADPAFEQAQA